MDNVCAHRDENQHEHDYERIDWGQKRKVYETVHLYAALPIDWPVNLL